MDESRPIDTDSLDSDVLSRKTVSSNPSEYGYIYSAERPSPLPEVGWKDKQDGQSAAVNLYSENVVREGDTTETVDRESIANLSSTKQRWEHIFNAQPEGAAAGAAGLKKKAPPKWEVRLPYKEKHAVAPPVEGSVSGSGDSTHDLDLAQSSVASSSRPQTTESAIEREIRLAHEREEMLRLEKAERVRQLQQREQRTEQEQQQRLVACDASESDSYQPAYDELTEADRGPNLWTQGQERLRVTATEDRGCEESDGQTNHTESIIEREIRLQQEREAEVAQLRQLHGDKFPKQEVQQSQDVEESWLPAQQFPYGTADSDRPGSSTPSVASETDSLTDSAYRSGRRPSDYSRNVRVQPLMVDDPEDEEKPDYFKKQETPLEREMRVARERENELRRQKGLPEIAVKEGDEYYSSYGATTPDRDEASSGSRADYVERNSFEGRLNAMTPRFSSGGNAMKKFASNRLQQELKQQKERELALRDEGKIISTSEEHVQSLKYTEVAGVDRVDGTEKKNFVTEVRSPAVSAPKGESSAAEAATPLNTGVIKKSGAVGSGGRLFTYKEFKQTAESKIERELREMREREEELKQLRVSKS